MANNKPNDGTIRFYAQTIFNLDVERPYGDDVMTDPIKSEKLMQIANKRLTLMDQLEEFDEQTQRKIGAMYHNLIDEYNKNVLKSTKSK